MNEQATDSTACSACGLAGGKLDPRPGGGYRCADKDACVKRLHAQRYPVC